MNEVNTGGPAFPLPSVPDGNCACWNTHGGMSLRQWYAGQALTGITAQPDERIARGTPDEIAQCRRAWAVADAEYCFRMADAMIAHEAKEQE